MERPVGVLFAAVVASLGLAAPTPCMAQAWSDQPAGGGVAQQLKSGANRVGEGAAQIGEGIREGAITTWESIKVGAAAATARFNGTQEPSTTYISPNQQSN